VGTGPGGVFALALHVPRFVMLGDEGIIIQGVSDGGAVGAAASVVDLEHHHHSRDVVEGHVRFGVLET
jgi:hypothetical protein